MSKRDWKIFVFDMLEAIDNILEYTTGINKDEFLAQKMIKDAVVRNLEILGEAANQIPLQICLQYAHINWADITGLRNIVIHQYFGVDYNIIWKIITDELNELRENLSKITHVR